MGGANIIEPPAPFRRQILDDLLCLHIAWDEAEWHLRTHDDRLRAGIPNQRNEMNNMNSNFGEYCSIV